MKFIAAALLAAVGFTEAKKVIDKKALMRGAIPVDKNGNRRLADQGFEITGQYSIKFNHCLSLKISADDYEDVLFDGNVIADTKEGKVLAQISYVLFNVCQTDVNCYYDDDETLYMVDLPTYMGSITEGYQQKSEQFCEACQESYDSCYYNQNQQNYNENQDQQQDENQQDGNQDGGDENGDQQDGNQDGGDNNQDGGDNDGGRRLQEEEAASEEQVVYYDGQGYIVVDCGTCEAKGCFEEEQEEEYDENNANYQITDQVIENWIENMLGCVDTGIVGPTGEDDLYAGFICNSDGTGVEPAIFLDDACAVYTSVYSYGNVVSGTNSYDIMYKASDSVTAPFLNTQSCEYIEYVSIEEAENLAYEANQQNQNQDNQNQDQYEEEEAPEAAEVCQNLMGNAVDLDTCGGYEDDDNQDEDEDAYEEQDEDYSWYEYLVAADAADDVQGSCVVISALQGEFSTAHTYNEDDGEGGGSGHVYDYKSASAAGGAMSAGQIFGIIIAVIVVIVAAVLIMQSMGGKKDNKKVPLVNNKGGAMA